MPGGRGKKLIRETKKSNEQETFKVEKIVVDDGHWVPTGTTRYGRVIKTKRPKDAGN